MEKKIISDNLPYFAKKISMEKLDKDLSSKRFKKIKSLELKISKSVYENLNKEIKKNICVGEFHYLCRYVNINYLKYLNRKLL